MKRNLALLIGTAVVFAATGVRAGDKAGDKAFHDGLAKLIDRYSDDGGDDRMKKALDLCQARVKDAPKDMEARLELARIELAKNDYEPARADAEKVIAGTDAERAKCAHALLVMILSYGAEEKIKKETQGKSGQEKTDIEKKIREEARTAQHEFVQLVGSPNVASDYNTGEQNHRDLLLNLEEIGKPPKAIGAKDTAGKDIDLAEYKGKVVMVEFWHTGLATFGYDKDVPVVVKAYKDYHSKGFEAVGIAVDVNKDKVAEFLSKQGVPWRQLSDGKGGQNEVYKAWKPKAMPTRYLIDQAGLVRYIGVNADAVGNAVKEMLDRAKKKK